MGAAVDRGFLMCSPKVSRSPGDVNRFAWRLFASIRRSGVRVLSVISELDAAGGCFASLQWLAARAGVHRNTARRWIRHAQRIGVLVVVPQRTARGATRSSLLVPVAPVGPITEDVLRVAEHRERCEQRWTARGPLRDETLDNVRKAARNGGQAPEAQERVLGVPVLPRPVFGFAAELWIRLFDEPLGPDDSDPLPF